MNPEFIAAIWVVGSCFVLTIVALVGFSHIQSKADRGVMLAVGQARSTASTAKQLASLAEESAKDATASLTEFITRLGSLEKSMEDMETYVDAQKLKYDVPMRLSWTPELAEASGTAGSVGKPASKKTKR